MKRLLVVDTSVIHSAGETKSPVSSSCRNTLIAILEICHRVAMTGSIKEEWDRHLSRFSRKWRCWMAGKKKPIKLISNCKRLELSFAGFSDKDEAAIEKDRCFLEAAFSADKVIVTSDEELQKILDKTPQGKKIKSAITWINPVNNGDTALKNL